MAYDFYDSELSQFDDLQRRSLKMGMTLACVTNIKDPENKNRVLCKPITNDNEKDVLETEWCDVIQPLSGKNAGTFLFPCVDDVVLLGYLDGDPHCPYVIGGVWDQTSTAPYTIQDGKNTEYSFKTPTGTEIHIHEEKDKQKIEVKTPKGTQLVLDDEQESVTVEDKNKKNSITLKLKDGEIEIKADKKLTMAAGKTTFELTSDGKATLNASGDVTLKGSSIKGNASGDVELKGSSATVNASGKLTLKGSSADLKGSMGVNIN